MVISGVLAWILAAVSALPFTPPAGWVQLPQSMVGARVTSVWQGPKPVHGSPPSFTAVTFPFPGTVQMLVEGETKSSAVSGVVKTLADNKLQLCGTPAYLMTKKVNAGAASAILQQEISVKSGYAYMLMYTRPAAASANTQISAVMRA